MFKTYLNHNDVNGLLKAFENHLDFVDYKEEQKTDQFDRIIKTVYRAITTKGERNLEIVFTPQCESRISAKNHIATLSFVAEDSEVLKASKIKSDKYKIAALLEKIYSPNFNKAIELINWFIDEGEKSGVINNANLYESSKNYYSKKVEDHIIAHSYDRKIIMSSVNMATVYFNNILQKTEFKVQKKFKTSLINIDIIWLVHSDNTMHPYFKIRLPFFENKKTSVLLTMKADKVFLYLDDKQLYNTTIDFKTPDVLDESHLRNEFRKLFEKQIKNAVANRLKISKTELQNLNAEELKEYFILLEMVDI